MKKTFLLSLTIVTVWTLIMPFSLSLAQTAPTPTQIPVPAENFMGRLSLPDDLHPDYAPDVKIKGEDEPGYEAAYGNFILQLLAGGLLYMAAPVAILIIVQSGIKYITSHGNQNQMEGAKKTLMYAIIGLIIIVFSFAIVKAIIQAVAG